MKIIYNMLKPTYRPVFKGVKMCNKLISNFQKMARPRKFTKMIEESDSDSDDFDLEAELAKDDKIFDDKYG